MESLIRQTRTRYSGVGKENKEETGDIKDRRIPPQKSQSFKGEKKKPQNWFQKQFFRQMSQDNDSIEYSAAVAAAAVAINSLEELSIADQKSKSEEPSTSLTKTKSKTEDTASQGPETAKVLRWFSGEPSMRNLEGPDKTVPVIEETNKKIPEKAPSIKKPPTFVDKDLNNTSGRKPDSAIPKTDLPSAKRPAFPPTDVKRQSSTKPGIVETEADAWEKAEMAKIKERYEKVNTTILDWESRKKAKAKRRNDRTESELQNKRARALRHFHIDIGRIDKIAGGARAQAGANRRNEELKVKEKANKFRSTGKIPATCFCF
ncbi:Remorin like [Actinidia chinensis var. chinensis]|uniref:Remorin like n=1 Tax=Actinidia chinensis var. chinensis TaxID=1590841 RepID=A0A2R6P3Y4_ACTCC|nr:Remorin like [Actinidia chinensis var. chinensis]